MIILEMPVDNYYVVALFACHIVYASVIVMYMLVSFKKLKYHGLL